MNNREKYLYNISLHVSTWSNKDSNNSHIFDVIRHLMFNGTPYNGNFCYQFMLNLEGMPDNVFHTPFNVKSKK